jgi:divinyl protochlorophyllide a 8-vinyl-reductase
MPAHAQAAIGPNAVTRLSEALQAAGLAPLARQLFESAGKPDWLDHPPGAMVDEIAVARLHQATRARLPSHTARAILSDAGRRTANYLLAARIPKPVQILLKCLPPGTSARILISAIRRNAWTFAGSGHFTAEFADGCTLIITNNPLCAGEHAGKPVCAWHEAVFLRLFQTLVSPSARIAETACSARGDPCCCFQVRWGRPITALM